MIDLYLRAESEAEAKAALPDFVDAEGNWRLTAAQWAFDPLGQLIDQPAVWNGPGELVAGAAYLPGWHANLRLLDENLLPVLEASLLLIAPPASPARLWA